MPRTDFIHSPEPQYHITRHREIVRAHPEVLQLTGTTPTSAAWVAALVTFQFALAAWSAGAAWWLWLPVAYVVGATIDHALWVLIHECTHHLVFKRHVANRVTAMIANLPLVIPAAQSFTKYHLLHHQHLGEMDYDADVPGPVEARIVRPAVLKAAWLAAFPGIQSIVRTRRLRKVAFLDGWIAGNIAVQVAAMILFYRLAGWTPLVYLLVSSLSAIGLHPLGARWIQEHFVFADGQETYSYYGPLNRVCFNMGYHNEHHDFVTIPWSRLPKLKAAAPEFYDTLYAHRSWTGLLVRFITDPRRGLFDRIVHPSR